MPIYVAVDATLGEVTPQRGEGPLGHDGYGVSASGTPDSEPDWSRTGAGLELYRAVRTERCVKPKGVMGIRE
jgi:hypothetical protein